MPKKTKKTSEAGRPDDYWVERPHPRGERTPSLLESLEEELGLPRIFQEAKEEEETPTPSAPRTVIARRPQEEPVVANLSGLFSERQSRVALLDHDDEPEDVLGGIFGEDAMDVDGGVDDDDIAKGVEGDDGEEESVDGDSVAAGAGMAMPLHHNAADLEEVATSSSYVVERPASTVSL